MVFLIVLAPTVLHSDNLTDPPKKMRTNLPVTNQEFDYPSDEFLMSTTDPQGRMTHCNAAFVRVSGFAMEELMGQPHNIVRHPDMPREAFKDLWTTIGHGRAWSGVVKNLRKDGRYYWVRAYVTPIMEHGKPVGYMSVRVKPTDNEVRAASALYERLKATRQEGIVFKKLASGYRSGYNDDQIKMPFFESCTVQVVAHHKTKRSISVQGFDKDGLPDPLGWITVPSNYPMPPVGALVDTEYLYRVKALVRTIYRGIRTDQTLASCSTVNLKYRADIGGDDIEDESDAALLAA